MTGLMKWLSPVMAVALMIGWSGATVRADEAPAKAAVGTITGKVVDKDGKGVANVTVNLLPPAAAKAKKDKKADITAAPKAAKEKPAKGDKKKGADPIATTTTGADGSFTLNNVAVGEYSIEAGSKKGEPGFAKASVSVKEGDTVTVPLTLVAK